VSRLPQGHGHEQRFGIPLSKKAGISGFQASEAQLASFDERTHEVEARMWGTEPVVPIRTINLGNFGAELTIENMQAGVRTGPSPEAKAA